ncbi:MAG: hypothetical protein ACK4UO_14010 [Pseudolabrys sp.]
MKKLLFAALAFAGTVWLTAPADAAPRAQDGIANATVTDLSAHRRRYRHTHRRVVRHYYAPRYYGYYGPTYYERPYRRPAPLWFGIGGHW